MQDSSIMLLNAMDHHKSLTSALHSFICNRFLSSLDLFFCALKEIFLPFFAVI